MTLGTNICIQTTYSKDDIDYVKFSKKILGVQNGTKHWEKGKRKKIVFFFFLKKKEGCGIKSN